MKRAAEVLIQVPFHDADPANMAWHGHYAKYFELARCALLDSFDYGYTQMSGSGYIWPIIELWIRYAQPARFGQRIRVGATLTEWQHRLKIEYLVSDADGGARLTRGRTIQVAVNLQTGCMCLTSPPVLFEKLGMQR
jgi:acyl-CoA thioester hydrolase